MLISLCLHSIIILLNGNRCKITFLIINMCRLRRHSQNVPTTQLPVLKKMCNQKRKEGMSAFNLLWCFFTVMKGPKAKMTWFKWLDSQVVFIKTQIHLSEVNLVPSCIRDGLENLLEVERGPSSAGSLRPPLSRARHLSSLTEIVHQESTFSENIQFSLDVVFSQFYNAQAVLSTEIKALQAVASASSLGRSATVKAFPP